MNLRTGEQYTHMTQESTRTKIRAHEMRHVGSLKHRKTKIDPPKKLSANQSRGWKEIEICVHDTGLNMSLKRRKGGSRPFKKR